MNAVELLSPADAAGLTHRHAGTIRLALETGELHGYQRTRRGRWSIRRACLDAWIENRPCEHKQTNISPFTKKRA